MPFPLVDLRKGYDESWQQVHTNEIITVPSTPPYVVKLTEVPDNGNVNSKPSITGLTRTNIYPPGIDQFYVNYRTGTLVFHENQKGQTLTVSYWKIGSIIQCSDINYIHNCLPRRSTFVKNTGLIVNANSSQIFNIDGFGNYGLVYKFTCSQLTGDSSGPYTIEFYDSTNFDNILYRTEEIVPSEEDPFIDKLPFMIEDLNLKQQLHCKIYNQNINSNATYSISFVYLKFSEVV